MTTDKKIMAYLETPNGTSLQHLSTEFPNNIDPEDGPNVVAWAIDHWNFDPNDSMQGWSIILDTGIANTIVHDFE